MPVRKTNKYSFLLLTFRFLQQNCITTITGLENQASLDTLNLNNNLLKEIPDLSHLVNLKTLQVAHNHLRTAEGLENLKTIPSLTVLDLENNGIEDPALVDILVQLPNLVSFSVM